VCGSPTVSRRVFICPPKPWILRYRLRSHLALDKGLGDGARILLSRGHSSADAGSGLNYRSAVRGRSDLVGRNRTRGNISASDSGAITLLFDSGASRPKVGRYCAKNKTPRGQPDEWTWMPGLMVMVSARKHRPRTLRWARRKRRVSSTQWFRGTKICSMECLAADFREQGTGQGMVPIGRRQENAQVQMQYAGVFVQSGGRSGRGTALAFLRCRVATAQALMMNADEARKFDRTIPGLTGSSGSC